MRRRQNFNKFLSPEYMKEWERLTKKELQTAIATREFLSDRLTEKEFLDKEEIKEIIREGKELAQ